VITAIDTERKEVTAQKLLDKMYRNPVKVQFQNATKINMNKPTSLSTDEDDIITEAKLEDDDHLTKAKPEDHSVVSSNVYYNSKYKLNCLNCFY
jgi:hypothetical protein